ncbi:unnamed protein product [Protopolystoma xenopodis]|uniref:Uncharacterized protein n=1 Tax=Protopolystoma xenopodis TaxID=117903 RepID=A0A3S5A2L7_9PLAT|nr:unnamed protein product [Protopolystoma xenopodis]
MAKLTYYAVYNAAKTFENVPSPLSDAGNHDNYYSSRLRTSCNSVLTMVPLADNADETFGNVASQLFNAGTRDYYGRGHGTRYVPQCLHDIWTNNTDVLAISRQPQVCWTIKIPWYENHADFDLNMAAVPTL